MRVVFSLPGKIRENLETMANIANDEKRRPSLGRWKSLGVVLRLLPGIEHQHVPGAGRSAPATWRRLLNLGFEKIALLGFRSARPPALLGFKHEGAAPIEVDPAERGRSICFAKGDGALERISIQA
nr:hypothetical protein [Methyloferula stellata]